MPRRPHLALAGVAAQIIQRGNNRGASFFADEDYALDLRHLEELARLCGCAVHAYVLMTNHVHLLVTPKEAHATLLLMKHLGQRYVQYVNRAYRRSGTLWEGRFRSWLAGSESYVLACNRYVELNPVRADMVAHPRAYCWSSYRANTEGKDCELLTPHREYLRLAKDPAQRRAAHRALFRTELDPETVKKIREATNGGCALGGTRFLAQIKAAAGRRVTRGKAGRPARQDVAPEAGQQDLF